MLEPEVAVIVPARNAQATITLALEALRRQDFTGTSEIVVVDDASSDDTGALAEASGARVVRRDTQGGPAVARNAGVASTRAPLIAFTDADCEPAPGWLSALVEALRDADLVTGPVVPAGPVGFFDRTLRLGAESPRFETANLACRREAYDRAGGFEPFDAAGGRPGLRPRMDQGHFGEDAVFGWRAVRSGARTAFALDALVRHAVFERGPRGYIAERWRLRFFPALLREAPEMRSALTAGLFLSRRTALFDLALVGALVAVLTRRPWPLALAAPYARRFLRTDQLWRRSVARQNLAFITADAVGLVALVRGSVAARRPVL